MAKDAGRVRDAEVDIDHDGEAAGRLSGRPDGQGQGPQLQVHHLLEAQGRPPSRSGAIPVAIFSAEEGHEAHVPAEVAEGGPGRHGPPRPARLELLPGAAGVRPYRSSSPSPRPCRRSGNPVPRVPHPDWLQRRINIKDDKMKQKKVTDHFTKAPLEDITNLSHGSRLGDMEDYAGGASKLLKPRTVDDAINAASQKAAAAAAPKARKRKSPETADQAAENDDPFAALPKVMPSPSDDLRGLPGLPEGEVEVAEAGPHTTAPPLRRQEGQRPTQQYPADVPEQSRDHIP